MAEPSTKQTTAAEKTKKMGHPPAHPKYTEMVTEAIRALKERGGCSRQKILKYIISNFKVGEEKTVNTHVKSALKKLVETGMLKQNKGTGASGSFRLGEAAKKIPAKPKRSATTKTPAAFKRSTTAKKPTAVKKPASEKKSSATMKSATENKASATMKSTGAKITNPRKKIPEEKKSTSSKIPAAKKPVKKTPGENKQRKSNMKTKPSSNKGTQQRMKKLTPAKLKPVKAKTSKVIKKSTA